MRKSNTRSSFRLVIESKIGVLTVAALLSVGNGFPSA